MPVASGRRGEERIRHARDGQVGAEVDEHQPFVGGLVREEPQKQRLGAEDRAVDPGPLAGRKGHGLATEPQQIPVEPEDVATLVDFRPIQSVQFTTYLVHSQDIPKFMAFRKREFPRLFPDGKYPPNTLLMIDRLVGEPFLVEVQPVAAL